MSKTWKDEKRYEDRGGKWMRDILLEEHPAWFKGQSESHT
jgi:hypothetical protein